MSETTGRSARPRARGRAPSDAARSGSDPDDLRVLLDAAVARLARDTGAPRVAVWTPGEAWTPGEVGIPEEEGIARAWAATSEAAGAQPPPSEILATMAQRARATDLGAEELPATIRALAARAGLGAAVALGQSSTDAPILVLGGPDDAAGRVRRATLDALDAAAASLAGPVDVARAAARISALGDQVQRLDALASLGELASELVHEIRNPLVSVKTFLQLLPERAHDPAFRKEFLEVVGEEVRRIERLLALVLDQARPERAPAGAEGTDPRGVLDDVVRLLSYRARERGVTLETHTDAAVPVPMGRDALHQVVLNLALNALDATPRGGRVRLLALAAEGAARIACEDEGPGIPEALRERVFEPFFSTKSGRPGGLGLAIVRRMVLASGGTLRLEDRSGGGTRIALAWPRR